MTGRLWCCGLALCVLQASAADYPVRPMRVIVANVPGSGVDVLTRIVTARLGAELGQHIVVDNRIDNRPGAGTAYGMEIGRNAAADGYTLNSAATASLAIAPLIYRKQPQSVLDDYEFISLFAITPNVLVVTPALPLKTVADLVAWSKTQPQVKMASGGAGSQNHLAGALLYTMGKFPATHAPYRGSTAPVAAVMAGEAQWTLTPAPAVWPQAKAGRLRALGHSLPKRTPLLGDLPAIAETIPGYDYSGWFGLVAPKGTPQPVLEKLRSALLKVLARADIRDAFAEQASVIGGNTPDEFRRLVLNEQAKYREVVKAAGLKPDQ
jgi:tripartite-type tricarboxylate transporter receptor subunit TctC